jgi:cellulose synthase/poly-beta-1,6-N-acetylglucosamine synthase-like glycosyltransferase
MTGKTVAVNSSTGAANGSTAQDALWHIATWWHAVLRFLRELYGGLPIWAQPLLYVALVLIIVSLISLIVLLVKAQRRYAHARRLARSGSDPAENESDYLWIFMIPALNEEVTIADAVGRLEKVELTHFQILVINDGSDDDTPKILRQLQDTSPHLTVLTREKPHAREGKSEALNAAWRYTHDVILSDGPYAGWDPAKTIVTIVDADGRLSPEAGQIAQHFDDPAVGGVQAQVRIYNRKSPLTLAQDIEFGVFGSVFQLGRTNWGTANMGGNGQFNRLSALDSVAIENDEGLLGPWKSGRLTEDQDIGLRMILAGWHGEQAVNVDVNQQGLNSLRALLRQRTRWSQGTWQVLDLTCACLRNKKVRVTARLDQLWYLLTPIIQAWLGMVLVLSICFLIFKVVDPTWSWILFVISYLFAAMPSVLGVFFARRGRGVIGFIINILFAHLYLAYSWIIYPVVYRALFRQIIGAKSWAKTARESLEEESLEEKEPGEELGEPGIAEGAEAGAWEGARKVKG